jgi:Flp pilus assembly pilin Flp
VGPFGDRVAFPIWKGGLLYACVLSSGARGGLSQVPDPVAHCFATTTIAAGCQVTRPAWKKGHHGMFDAMNQKGQGMVEYILIAVLVVIVLVAAWMILNPIILDVLSTINNSLQTGG